MSLPELVAQYIAAYFPSALDSFVHAACIPRPDATNPITPGLQDLLDDRHLEQATNRLNLSFTTAGINEIKAMVNRSLPQQIRLGSVRRTIKNITAVNLLCVDVKDLPSRRFDTTTAQYYASTVKTIITASVDKTIKLINYSTGEVDRLLEPHRATVLCFAVHPEKPRYMISGSMDGTTVLTDLITQQSLQTFPSQKFVVRVAFSQTGLYFATASYDKHIVLYKTVDLRHSGEDLEAVDDTDDPQLACEPSLRYSECLRIPTDSNPEALVFSQNSLMYTLRNSHLLYYVDLSNQQISTKSFNAHPLDTHVSFAVLNMVIHPSGRIVACQTGDRGAERILLYGIESSETEQLACLWTGQDADTFVMPRMAWLPDGTGLIVTSADGKLRLLSLKGEIRSILKVHGSSEHGSSQIVRDCCIVGSGANWEVVSVGYDKEIKISR